MRRALLASAAALIALAIPAAAQAGTGGEAPPAGVVSLKPPANVPHLPVTTSQVEQIRQLVQCGGTMYAVGTFTTIRRNSTTYTRDNVFSFSATAPYAVTSLGTGRRRHLRDHVQREQHREHDRVRGRQLRERLHRRPLLLGQRHRRQEHRQDQHDHRERDHGVQVERIRPGGNHRRGRQSPADRRPLHRHQRRHHRLLLRQPEPGDRQERRLPAPVRLWQLPVPWSRVERDPRVQPAAQPRPHQGPGGRRLHLGRRPEQAAGVHAGRQRPVSRGDRLERPRVHH